MQTLDKNGIFNRISEIKPLILELGCGNRKRQSGSIGIDILDSPSVDIVGDVSDVLRLFPDASVDAIYSYHFLEHVADLAFIVREMARVLRPGGEMNAVVPHFSNPYYYSDPTHKTFFGLYTFSYLAHESLFRRRVPTYGAVLELEVIEIDLIFKSARPFYFRHALKVAIGGVFNCCRFAQEFYEENLSPVFSCYEVRFMLKRMEKR